MPREHHERAGKEVRDSGSDGGDGPGDVVGGRALELQIPAEEVAAPAAAAPGDAQPPKPGADEAVEIGEGESLAAGEAIGGREERHGVGASRRGKFDPDIPTAAEVEVGSNGSGVHRGIGGGEADEVAVAGSARHREPVQAPVTLIQHGDEPGAEAFGKEVRVLGKGIIQGTVAVEVVPRVLRAWCARRRCRERWVVNVRRQGDGRGIGEVNRGGCGGEDPVGFARLDGREFLQGRARGRVVTDAALAGRRAVVAPDLLNEGELVPENGLKCQARRIGPKPWEADEVPARPHLHRALPSRVREPEEAGLVHMNPVAVARRDGGEVVRVIGVCGLEGNPRSRIAKVPCGD